VVLPVWNGERFLVEAVESVLSQTLKPLELLLVDDGSTDATPEIASGYARRDSRVRVIQLDRSGIAHALNAGIAAARGRYVARMDADDISHPSRLQKQLAHLDANAGCVAVGSAVHIMDETGGHVGTGTYPEDHTEIAQSLIDGRTNPMAHPTVMARRAALLTVGGYRPESVPSEDLDLWFRLSRIGTLANMSEQLLRYRRHANTVSIRERERQWSVGMGIVNEARGKKGLHPLEPRALRPIGSRVAAYHFECARIALMTGPRTAAIRHAFASIAAEPLWREPYVALAACAFPKWTLRALAELTAPFRSPYV
jgi:Glycosyl transferase family 2